METVHPTSLFHLMPVPGVLVDRHGTIVAANALALQTLDLPDDLAHRPVSMLRVLSDVSRPQFFHALLRRPAGESVVVPRLLVGPQASQDYRPTDVHFIRLPGVGSDFGLTLVAFLDRTADEDRERDRRLFQAVLDHAGAAISAFDAEGRCLVANDAFALLVGRSRDEVLGAARTDLFSGSELAEATRADVRVLSSREPEVTEVRRFVGTRAESLATHRFPMLDEEGRAFAVGAVATDISDLRATELQLQLAMEVFARGSEAIVICDGDRRIVSVNAAFSELTGYPEAEALGRTLMLLRSERHDDDFYERMWTAVESANRWEGEMWSRRRDGSDVPHSLRLSRVLDEDGGVRHHIAIMSDVTERRAAEARIERLAFYDELTGAPTRRLLMDRLAVAVADAERTGTTFAVVFLDLDHFKEINDTMGHDAGDDLLAQVADRLRTVVLPADTVARFGGDEFVLLLREVEAHGVGPRADEILAAFDAPFTVGGRAMAVSASVGIARHPQDGPTPQELIKNADTAMYQAKAQGRRAWRFFNSGVDLAQHRAAQLSMGLRSALDARELWLAYQPQVRLTDGRLTGLEVLLRWRNDTLADPAPGEFVPVAEDTGLIVPITEWVLRTAVAQVSQWRISGMPRVRLAVNMAASHFDRPELPTLVLDTLAGTKWPPAQLELEITERLAMRRPDVSTRSVGELRSRGVRFAIDDFGTGYSSLSYLRRFPIDTLKIDRSFVANVGRYYEDETVITSVVALATALGKQCVAEGVETEEQERFLRALGCGHAQGNRYGPPMAAEELWDWHAQRAVRV